jgi:hypothetical protein
VKADDIRAAPALIDDPEISFRNAAKRLGLSVSPLYRHGEGLMPIRRQHRWIYAIDWPQISASIRFGSGKGRCEQCGRPHGRWVFHLGDGRWWDDDAKTWRNGKGRALSRAPADTLFGDN